MKKKKQEMSTRSLEQKLTNEYDDNNIPKEDLPQDMIPDEVPRKDGPGGEGEK